MLIIKNIYGYHFDLKHIENTEAIPVFNGSTVLISKEEKFGAIDIPNGVDFFISLHGDLGSILFANGEKTKLHSDIQHVRRRETIAMTPADSLTALKSLVAQSPMKLQ
jgi:hypothetical protein